MRKQSTRKQTGPQWIKKIISFLRTDRGSSILLTFSIFVFICYFMFAALIRHNNFHSLRIDLGNMDQTVWNVVHGHGFTLTDPMGSAQESRLAVHADFLLVLMAPLYILWSDPRVLIIIQVIALACGAVPLFWLARKILKRPIVAYIFALSYLLYPTVGLNALHDFHATSLSTTFFLFAFWYLVDEKLLPFAIFALLAALGKEQFWFVTALLGFFWMVKKRYRLFGICVTIVSAVMFYLLFWVFIPAVTPAHQHWALIYLSDYGGSMNQIIKNLLLHPQQAVRSAFALDRLYYYFQLLFPVGFFSLFSPIPLILTLPDLPINILSNDAPMRMIDYQYTAGITPWIFVSAIYGYKFLDDRIRKLRQFKRYNTILLLSGLLIVASFISSCAWGEYPYEAKSRLWYFQTVQPETQIMAEFAKNIPSKYSVSVTNNIGAHFSQRQYLYNFPQNAAEADYVAVLLGDINAWPSPQDQVTAVRSLLANRSYTLVIQAGMFFGFKKVGLPSPNL